MSRKETTKLLTEILIQERMADRKYYAKEVTLDYGAAHPKRVDVMQFLPKGTTSASDIEKGIFICYEIKSCVQDVYSGHGLNFYGEKNYVVCTMETYKKLMPDIREGKFDNYRKTENPESSKYYGFLVPIPKEIDLHDSDAMYKNFMEPKKFGGDASEWKLWTAAFCREGRRNRPVTELLFCMLRSKHNYTNSFEEKSETIAQQWIPCEERLPEYGEPVLTWDGSCFFVEKRIPYIVAPDIGDHVESDWWVSDDYDGTEYYPNLRDGACIAWMPLPEPWKGSEDEEVHDIKPQYEAKVITRGNCMMCGKELTEGLFLCKECKAKAVQGK